MADIENVTAEENPSEPTIEELKAQLAQERAANAKAKNRIDELCSNEGKLKKALREKQTAEEAEEAAKAERAEAERQRVSNLERELGIIKASNRYMSLGFDAEQAETVATLELDGDKDAWADAVNKHLINYKAELEKSIRAEYAAKMPTPQSGNSSTVDYSKVIADATARGDQMAVVRAIREQAMQNGFDPTIH